VRRLGRSLSSSLTTDLARRKYRATQQAVCGRIRRPAVPCVEQLERTGSGAFSGIVCVTKRNKGEIVHPSCERHKQSCKVSHELWHRTLCRYSTALVLSGSAFALLPPSTRSTACVVFNRLPIRFPSWLFNRMFSSCRKAGSLCMDFRASAFSSLGISGACSATQMTV